MLGATTLVIGATTLVIATSVAAAHLLLNLRRIVLLEEKPCALCTLDYLVTDVRMFSLDGNPVAAILLYHSFLWSLGMAWL